MSHEPGALVAAFEAAVAELGRQAVNAAARNKPTMWAYLSSAQEDLREWFGFVEQSNEAYADELASLIRRAQVICPMLEDPIEAARAWTMAAYARRILRAAGYPAPQGSLAWLRQRTGAVRP
jgi:hypothetical protein